MFCHIPPIKKRNVSSNNKNKKRGPYTHILINPPPPVNLRNLEEASLQTFKRSLDKYLTIGSRRAWQPGTRNDQAWIPNPWPTKSLGGWGVTPKRGQVPAQSVPSKPANLPRCTFDLVLTTTWLNTWGEFSKQVFPTLVSPLLHSRKK